MKLIYETKNVFWILLNVTPIIFYLRQSWCCSWSHHTTRRDHVHAGVHIINTNVSSHTVTVGSTWTKKGSTGTIWARIRQRIHLRSTLNEKQRIIWINFQMRTNIQYLYLDSFIKFEIAYLKITQHICGCGYKDKTKHDSSHFSIWWIISCENNKILLCVYWQYTILNVTLYINTRLIYRRMMFVGSEPTGEYVIFPSNYIPFLRRMACLRKQTS